MQRILDLQKRWRVTVLLIHLAWALFAALVVALSSSLLYGSVAFVVVFFVLLIVDKRWRIPVNSLVQHLNQTYPSLEESTQLLMLPAQSIVQQLQQNRVRESLQQLDIHSPFRKQLLSAIAFLLIAIITFAVFKKENNIAAEVKPTSKRKEVVPASIKSNTISIIPPAYTGLTPRSQQQFSIILETGAQVKWELLLNAPASNVGLLFNDGTSITMQENNGVWQAAKTINKSGFYQVKIDNRLSELYPIEAITDAPPVISVQSPQASLSLSYKTDQKFLWQSKVSDDYGISRLQLSVTVASGQGEAVKFHEQQISLGVQQNAKAQNVQHSFDCHALKMQPGDEVYIWLSATDNHGQETRSDVYVVSLQDTTGQITIDGLLKGLDVKPELFRSQRQIIIETEQLLRDKSKISVKEFQEKANDLGTDQKLLRLRYGKFLGEEFSAEIGVEHHEEGTIAKEKDEATKMMELYSHNHDIAEDATYFDEATKKQLRAMLTEMWNAELKLRTFYPKDALPYEYKALRLLKDLQQKSRAYVPKTTFTPPALQMDKRLSGDVSKVSGTVRQQTITNNDPLILLRKAIGVLEEIKTSGQLTANDIAILQPAYQQLSAKAAERPSVYLESVSAYRKVLNDAFRISDIRTAQKGLQQMLPPAQALPSAPKEAASSLSQAYLDNLRKSNR